MERTRSVKPAMLVALAIIALSLAFGARYGGGATGSHAERPAAGVHTHHSMLVAPPLGGTFASGDLDIPVLEEQYREAELARLEAERVEAARVAEEQRVAAEAKARISITTPPQSYAPAPPTRPWDGSIHAHPWMVCTRQHESDSGDANGNGLYDAGYGAISADGSFRGAYQFLRSTWDSTAIAAGRGDLVGIDPATASVADQDQMAWTLSNGGTNKGPWGGRC